MTEPTLVGAAGPPDVSSACKACGSAELFPFYSVEGIPTQTCVLLDEVDTARNYPTGDLCLVACRSCGFMQNNTFEPDKVDYSVPTEESQAYSPQFRSFSDELAKELWSRHDLADKSVLEIGCGKGDFLAHLASLGVDSALGIDPGFLPNRELGDEVDLRFIRDWFDERHTQLSADLILARHVLEHIPDVRDFASKMVRSAQRTPGSSIFIEVPDTSRVLREGAFWDVYYEHCSYFTSLSLDGLLRRVGVIPGDLRSAFEDQYLLADGVVGTAQPRPPSEAELDSLLRLVKSFEVRADEARQRWSRRFLELSGRTGRVAVWGGGSKAVAFLSSVDTAEVRLDVVDINPHKHHRFLPGSGLEVQSPEVLNQRDRMDLVVVMNPIYRNEIQHSLEKMGIAAPIMSVDE